MNFRKIVSFLAFYFIFLISANSYAGSIDDYGRNIKSHDREGGHIKARHIGKSYNYLRKRCGTKRWGEMSTFLNTSDAEDQLHSLIKDHRSYISSYAKGWHNSKTMNNNQYNFRFSSRGKSISCSKKGKTKIKTIYIPTPRKIIKYKYKVYLDENSYLTRVKGVLRRKSSAAGGWHLITAYPY